MNPINGTAQSSKIDFSRRLIEALGAALRYSTSLFWGRVLPILNRRLAFVAGRDFLGVLELCLFIQIVLYALA